MNNSAVFMQVRLASRRLPGKALLPLAGKTVIAHAMLSLAELPVDRHVLLTDEESAPALEREATACGYELFVGNPDDVLHRYCAAAERYGVRQIIRATGDNPLTSCAMARQAMQLQECRNADYAGILDTPYGTGVEVINAAALTDLNERTADRYDREHVSPGLYRRPDHYRIVTRPAPASLRMPELRVTLDTPADYEYISEVYRQLYQGRPIELAELIGYGHRHHQHSA